MSTKIIDIVSYALKMGVTRVCSLFQVIKDISTGLCVCVYIYIYIYINIYYIII